MVKYNPIKAMKVSARKLVAKLKNGPRISGCRVLSFFGEKTRKAAQRPIATPASDNDVTERPMTANIAARTKTQGGTKKELKMGTLGIKSPRPQNKKPMMARASKTLGRVLTTTERKASRDRLPEASWK